MHPTALTRASQLIHVTKTLERFGMSPERMLEQAQLPMWHYADPEDLIPTRDIYALMAQAVRSSGNPIFGLMTDADDSVLVMGKLDRLIANSLTVYHAFDMGCRVFHLHSSSGSYRLIEAGDEVWCCRSRYQGPDVGRRENEHYILMGMIKYARMGAGPSWFPAKICLQTPKAYESELREALGDPQILFEKEFTGIAIPRALLARPLRRRGPKPTEASETLERRLERTAPASNFVDSLRQVAGTLLKVGEPPRLETMAEIAGLSVRSLQRRLVKERLNHTQIVGQARYQAAASLLMDPENRITDIAMDQGYSDSTHFTRAFKRWAGVTPSEYRSQQSEV